MWTVSVILLAVAGITNGADEWSYDFETQWPGECTTGSQQSPINIMSTDAVVDKEGAHIKGPLVFRGYGNVNLTAENTGHALKWTIVDDEFPPTVSGGPLVGNYSLMQFHLHWLSEHAIDGMKYPMEIHMVHVKTGLTLDEALERPDGLVVIGVLCKVYTGETSEFALQELTPALPDLLTREKQHIPASVVDITRLFSPNMQSFYTYHGSLTTPHCQEVVTWFVMDVPLIISDTQYKLFSKVDVGGIDNYRSLQPVNRVIYRSVASRANLSTPGSIGILASLFNFSSAVSAIFSKGVCTVVNMKRKFLGNKLQECQKVNSS